MASIIAESRGARRAVEPGLAGEGRGRSESRDEMDGRSVGAADGPSMRDGSTTQGAGGALALHRIEIGWRPDDTVAEDLLRRLAQPGCAPALRSVERIDVVTLCARLEGGE